MSISTIADLIDNTEGKYEGDLKWYFKILFTELTNRYNPYHNLRHMLHVTWEAYDACSYYDLEPIVSRWILVAAMFHDANHSGRAAGNDDLEIERAIRAFNKYMDPVDSVRAKQIITIIKSTEYPYVVPAEDLHLPDLILRDADMSQTFSVAWMQQILFGLGSELGISPENFLQGQLDFIQNHLEFHTDWGKSKFEPQAQDRIAEIEKYLQFLKTPDPRST